MYKRTNVYLAKSLVMVFRLLRRILDGGQRCLYLYWLLSIEIINEFCFSNKSSKHLSEQEESLDCNNLSLDIKSDGDSQIQCHNNKGYCLKITGSSISQWVAYFPVICEDILTGVYILSHLIIYGSSLRHHEKEGHYYARETPSLVAIEFILIGPSTMWLFSVILNMMDFKGTLQQYPELMIIYTHFFNINTVAVLSFFIQTPYLYLNNMYSAGQDSTSHFITSLGHIDDDGGYFSNRFPIVNDITESLGIILAIMFFFELIGSVTQVNWYSLLIFQALFLFVTYSTVVQGGDGIVFFVNFVLLYLTLTILSCLVCCCGCVDQRVPCFNSVTVLQCFACEVLLVTIYPYVATLLLPLFLYKGVDTTLLLKPLLDNPSTKLSLLYEEKGNHFCCRCFDWCEKCCPTKTDTFSDDEPATTAAAAKEEEVSFDIMASTPPGDHSYLQENPLRASQLVMMSQDKEEIVKSRVDDVGVMNEKHQKTQEEQEVVDGEADPELGSVEAKDSMIVQTVETTRKDC